MKKTLMAFDSYKNEPNDDAKKGIQQSLNQTFSKIDKAVKRGVLHSNNGANQKSRLSLAFKQALGIDQEK